MTRTATTRPLTASQPAGPNGLLLFGESLARRTAACHVTECVLTRSRGGSRSCEGGAMAITGWLPGGSRPRPPRDGRRGRDRGDGRRRDPAVARPAETTPSARGLGRADERPRPQRSATAEFAARRKTSVSAAASTAHRSRPATPSARGFCRADGRMAGSGGRPGWADGRPGRAGGRTAAARSAAASWRILRPARNIRFRGGLIPQDKPTGGPPWPRSRSKD